MQIKIAVFNIIDSRPAVFNNMIAFLQVTSINLEHSNLLSYVFKFCFFLLKPFIRRLTFRVY